MPAGWENYDEKNPWGKSGKNSDVAAIDDDNLAHAQERRRAEKAVKAGTASPEQHLILSDTKRLWSRLRGNVTAAEQLQIDQALASRQG